MNEQVSSAEAQRSWRGLITAQAGTALPTDDVLLLALPLFEQVAALHAQNRVAILNADAIEIDEHGGLYLTQPLGQQPSIDLGAVQKVQPQPSSGLNIIGTLQRGRNENGSVAHINLDVELDLAATITRPVYLPGPLSWEGQLGHHDEITDVFQLGLMLASLACGLDFADGDDLTSFAARRGNLFSLYERLHPVVAAVIVEMTELNRHQRATDVAALATRLRTWREQPLALDVERTLAGTRGATPRRVAVLEHLRDRLFDMSRRNRLLYFRPSTASVNLTVASVPLVLQIESVKAEQICTWGGPFAQEVVGGKPVDLQRWLRFEDQAYLPAALDRLLTENRRDQAEYGFSNLRMVVAFLRWHNLKEAPEERILTPLLWLPVELVKRKGVRDQYVMQGTGTEAEFNPVLRHHLQQLYAIELPETVDLQKTSLADIHADILAQIRRSEPAVELRLVEKVAIRLVRQKALQRLQQYQRRKPAAANKVSKQGWLPPYSYAQDDYRPLGRALFEHWVRPSDLPQRFEAGATPSARRPQMVESASDDHLGFVLEESDGHRFAWDLDLTQVTLANFNYKKMSLVRDYAQLLDGSGANPAFDRVFSIEPRELETSKPPPLPQSEQWNVVAADATQNAAVSLARSQQSFIIQGPPGTGKSQTITNLIADYVARGKRVLFVCEKRAALDVVFHRLKQNGLAQLCCLIHDSQADKKAFIADLKNCYEQWIAAPEASDVLQQRRTALIQRLSGQLVQIEAFEQAMAAVPASIGRNVRTLLRRLVELPPPPSINAVARERLPNLAAWQQHADLIIRLHRAMRERFGQQSLAAHPFSRLAGALLADEHALGRIEQLCHDAETLYDTLAPLLDADGSLIHAHTPLADARRMAADCQHLLETGLASHLDLLDTKSAAHAQFLQQQMKLVVLAEALSKAQQATGHWRDKLTEEDTENALALARRLEPSLLRWLQPAWWKLRGELQRRYDFGKHAVHPGYSRVLQTLVVEQQAQSALDTVGASICKHYSVGEFQPFVEAFKAIEQQLRVSNGPRVPIDQLRTVADPVSTARQLAGASSTLAELAALIEPALAVHSNIQLGDLAELLRDVRESLEDLPELLPLLRAVHAGDKACVAMLQQLDYAPPELEALVSDEALRRLEREQPILARFGGSALAQAARTVAQCQREVLALNAEVMLARRQRQFGEHVRMSAMSVTQLDANGKLFKKNFATGRRELEHEFGKSMRFRSIRDLSDDETGLVINDLKPVWLMSPLSVSDTLPLTPDLFDVVIFDEASQIPTEESVPAMSRACQIIVVGDEMQLPPTSFFTASGGESDDEVVVEEMGERIAINLDSDSLLNQAARNLSATLLAWHYRSRHESLISFSNAAFYEGQLVTIPDRLLEQEQAKGAPLSSDQQQVGELGAEALLARPISFHRVSDGLYLERQNTAEARYIAQLVRELLRRDIGLSIGIVAFSEAQQSAIETALDALSEEDGDFATRLGQEYIREDDDQFNGLFVKNLENVQGDERDVIILSICYAPGPDGKMLMNFGPINQRGGEKRLNVIFSRARHRMAVVSTIEAEAITNVHNDGAAALRAFLQFAQASAAGRFERAQAVLGALNLGAQQAFARPVANDNIRDAIAAALRERGHQVHVNVGRSQFRCDMAIVAASCDRYTLAILLDAPAAVTSDALERYVFRPGILRSFGWQVLDIPSKDWLDQPEAVLDRIDAMLAQGEDPALDDEIGTPLDFIVPSPLPIAKDPLPSSPIAFTRRLRFEQGTSRKFWRASVQGTELSVNYGRIGSNGQTNIKQFETAARARAELEKLVAEKLGKGYIEDTGEVV